MGLAYLKRFVRHLSLYLGMALANILCQQISELNVAKDLKQHLTLISLSTSFDRFDREIRCVTTQLDLKKLNLM